MPPFETGAAADEITHAPTPGPVLAQLQPGDSSAVFFRSDVEYAATSLGTDRALSGLLSRENLAGALATRATAAGWPAPQLAAMTVAPLPPDPAPPEPEPIGVGSVVAASLLVLGCVALTVREIKRRRMRKSHKVYVEDAKAKDDAAREAESDAERERREELERLEREAEERLAIEKAHRIAEVRLIEIRQPFFSALAMTVEFALLPLSLSPPSLSVCLSVSLSLSLSLSLCVCLSLSLCGRRR
jgi:hypothetical protein